MNNRRLLVNACGLITVVALLAGCSSGSLPTPPPSTDATPQDSTPPTVAAETETVPPAGPAEQQTIPLASPAEQESATPVDPANLITGPSAEQYAPRTENGVDVIYFETSNPCSCMAAVGDAIDRAILTYFQDELRSGELRYFLLVSNAPANMDLIKTFNSQPFDLFVAEYQDGQETVEPIYDIWRLTGDKEAIVDFVRTRILSSLEDQR